MPTFFEGFDDVRREVEGVSLFAKVGGPQDAPPLVLLHGFPQDHTCWHAVAPQLAQRYRVVALDLKGYGRSSAPKGDAEHHLYSKRQLGREVRAFMTSLGYPRFAVAGHDRGALIGYRMALDTPEAVSALIILDNYPTHVIWEYMEGDPAFTPHWRHFAADDAEQHMTVSVIEDLVAAHTADGTLQPMNPTAMEAYRSTWHDPARVHAFCEDYRAGAFVDPVLDRVDIEEGRTVACPTFVIWGERFLGRAPERAVDIWRRTFAPSAEGVEVSGGHFNAEEAPGETADAMLRFLDMTAGSSTP